MRTLLTSLVMLAVVSAGRADSPGVEAAVKEFGKTARELAEAMSPIKDPASAKAARPRVAELAGRMLRVKAEMTRTDVADEQKTRLNKLIATDVAAFDAQFARMSLIPNAYQEFADLKLFRELAAANEIVARTTALKIDLALTAYFIQHGKYPPTLKDGFAALKREPPKDPWGRDFMYDPAGPRVRAANPRDDRPDIWVVSPYDGKKLLGNWGE